MAGNRIKDLISNAKALKRKRNSFRKQKATVVTDVLTEQGADIGHSTGTAKMEHPLLTHNAGVTRRAGGKRLAKSLALGVGAGAIPGLGIAKLLRMRAKNQATLTHAQDMRSKLKLLAGISGLVGAGVVGGEVATVMHRDHVSAREAIDILRHRRERGKSAAEEDSGVQHGIGKALQTLGGVTVAGAGLYGLNKLHAFRNRPSLLKRRMNSVGQALEIPVAMAGGAYIAHSIPKTVKNVKEIRRLLGVLKDLKQKSAAEQEQGCSSSYSKKGISKLTQHKRAASI